MDNKNIYIIGAGITGLVTAYELLKKGKSVTIFESLNEVGGMLRTLEFEDHYADLGPKLFHTFNSDIVQYWENLFPKTFLKKQFWCKNFKNGKLYDYPLSISTIKEFPRNIQGRIKQELKAVSASKRAAATNYKEYVESLVGPTLQRMFYEDYPKKIWGMDTAAMITNWAPKRIELRKNYTPFHYNQWCAVGRKGSGQIAEILRKKIEKMSGKILLNSTVTALNIKDNDIVSLTINNKKQVDFKNSILISTVPLNHLSRLLKIKNNLKFRSVAFVFMKFNKEMVFKDKFDWLYFDDPKLLFHRVTEQKRFSRAGLPKGSTTLCFEIACDKGDAVYNTHDSALINKTLRQFSNLGFVKSKDFASGMVRRMDEVYPKYFYGYEMKLASVNNSISKIRNLYNCGSLAEFSYADIQILFAKGIDLAELISSDYYRKNINIRQDYRFSFNKTVNLVNRQIGQGQKPFIIAEAGLNHNGDINIARELILKAKGAGCDAIKFQTFKAKDRVSSQVKSANYFEKTLSMEENYYEMLKKLELSEKDFKSLYRYAKKIGIPLFSTPFSQNDVDILESVGVELYKISSFDLPNLRLLKYVAAKGKPVILSTGMANMSMVEEALEALASCGNRDIVLLHCVSNYPMNIEDANLKAINTLKAAFDLPVGYSDHSIGLLTSNLAMALGANVIERHFTLSKYLEGPDHILSSDPAEMSELVSNSVNIPKILGDGIKRIQPAEFDTINKFRKSLFAAKDLAPGEVLDIDKISIKGPGHGLLPKYIDLVVGRKVKKSVAKDHPITWNDV